MQKTASLVDEKSGEVVNIIVYDDDIPEEKQLTLPEGLALVFDDSPRMEDVFIKDGDQWVKVPL